ncbi:hypothetical protein [Gimesia maris]|uniref:hypothetical protein n=1 Tax=Gimesia maris TaxID=122 RepID=UPI0024202F5E|nr:hypothetical protein [Gimesia maris]|tara:strand:- start:9692 stop:10102 length:411 start_codon:yes stop_codon:yes gene_type:complete
MKSSLKYCCVLLGFVLLVAGCGGEPEIPTGQVKGTVSYDGAPVTEGVISFYSSELGVGASADLTEEGLYSITDSLKTGTYAVTILPPPEAPPQDAIPVSTKKEYKNIPLKYRDPKKSELTVDISEGDNSFDVNMTN